MRDRVKCISATEGVPVSTQWEAQGYYYPTQIAQFGLSHYSKNLTDPEPRRKVRCTILWCILQFLIWLCNLIAHPIRIRLQTIENGDSVTPEWRVPNGSAFSRELDKRLRNNHIITFNTPNSYENAITLTLDHVLDLVFSIDLMLKPNSSLMVTLQNRETKITYRLHYIVGDLMLSVQDDNFYYGIGAPTTTWKHMTRDLLTDLTKGIQASVALSNNAAAAAASGNHASPPGEKTKRKHRRTEIKVIEIALLGAGTFDNITFATSEHIAQFYDAAEWFVRHQDAKTGGWPNPVKRKLSEFAELKAGWYSAMGQGHAISLLARAYHHSRGDMRHLKAAINGIKPFRVPSRQGGVLAKFLGKFDWYVGRQRAVLTTTQLIH